MSSLATMDTLEMFEELKKSFSDEQAHALSRVLKRVEESRLDELATKRDLREVKLEISAELAPMKWMLAVIVASSVALIMKSFFPV